MVKKYIYLGMSAILAVAGCTGPRGTGMPVPRPLGRNIQSFHASSDDVDKSVSAEAVERRDTITLRQALALALMKNPELAVYSWDIRAAEARILQAKVLPNPEMEIEVEEFGGSGETQGFDAAKMSIVLSQVIELGGKRAKRRNTATLEMEVAAWKYEAKRLDILTDTTQRLIDVLAAQQKLELAESELGIASNVHHAVSERVKAGKDSPLESIKSKGELASSKLTVIQAARNLAENRQRLAAMWGSKQAVFDKAVGSWPEMPKEIPRYKDIEQRLDQNPEMERALVDLNLAKASLATEKAARIPDLELVTGVEQSEAEDDLTFIAGVGVQIPVFDRNQGGIKEAQASVEKAKQNKKATEVSLHAELRAAYETLTYTKHATLTLAGEVLPAAQEAFSAAEEGYRAGKFSYLDVLDAQRTLFEAKSILLEVRTEYHKSLAKLERLTGENLSTIETKKGDR